MSNAHYHLARRSFLEWVGKLCNFLVIVFGTATVINFVGAYPTLNVSAGALVTVIGALQLVYDYSGKSRTHELLQRRYFELLSKVEECETPNPQFCSKIMGEIARITGEEPPPYRALEAITHNQTVDALYGKDRMHEKCIVTFWQSFTKNLLRHSGASFVSNNAQDAS